MSLQFQFQSQFQFQFHSSSPSASHNCNLNSASTRASKFSSCTRSLKRVPVSDHCSVSAKFHFQVTGLRFFILCVVIDTGTTLSAADGENLFSIGDGVELVVFFEFLLEAAGVAATALALPTLRLGLTASSYKGEGAQVEAWLCTPLPLPFPFPTTGFLLLLKSLLAA